MAAQDSIINHVVGLVSQPEMVNGLRNLIVLGKVLGNIQQTLEAGTPGDGKRRQAPPSLLTLASRGVRLGLLITSSKPARCFWPKTGEVRTYICLCPRRAAFWR